MHNNKKNEELQSRREFFKKAAKGALPIIAAVALAGIPNVIKAADTPMGCRSCSGGCSGGCTGTCYGTCQHTCKGSCNNTCYDRCLGTCKSSCQGGCKGGSR